MKGKYRILASLVVCLSLIPAGTTAYPNTVLQTRNVVTAGNIRLNLEETGGGILAVPATVWETSVLAENRGDFPAYVRLAVTPRLEPPSDNSQDGSEILSLRLDTVHWIYRDGYYYYYEALAPGERTTPLYDQAVISPELTQGGGKIRLYVTGFAVQTAHNGDSPLTAAGWPESGSF